MARRVLHRLRRRAARLAWIVGRGRRAAPSLWAAVPLGYRPAVVGLGVFAVGGGLLADLVISRVTGRRGHDSPTARAAALVCGAAVPLTMWSLTVALIAWRWEVNWPPELWAGSVVMAALAGVGLALITHPAPRPERWAAVGERARSQVGQGAR